MEDDLKKKIKKNGRRPQKKMEKKIMTTKKKNGKQPKQKWKTNQNQPNRL